MPRQIDLAPNNLAIANNPNVQLSVTSQQITSLFSNLAELALKSIEDAINEFIKLFDQVTGLDLSALANLLSGLDFSSPEAFITSLVQVLITLPETLIQLLESLVTQLASPAGVTSLTNMLESLISMLVSPSGLSTLTSLLTSIIELLVTLPELLLSLAGGLLGGGGLLGAITGSSTTGGGGLGGLTSFFTDFMGLLGAPTGLGTGSPTLPGVSSIPMLGPLVNMLIGGISSGGITAGSGGTLTQVLDDFMGILGNPTGLGTGSPIIPASSTVPMFGDMLGLIENIPGAAQAVLDTIVQTFLGLGGTGFSTNDLSRALQSIPASLLTGSMPAGMLSHLNIGTLSSVIPEFLTNPNFDTPNSISGQSIWTWDGTQGPAGLSTSVFATASGVLKELLSNTVAVAPGQTLTISGNTKWSGFSGAANSIALTVSKFDPTGLLLGYDIIGSIASPGSSGGWTLLSNSSYTVPSGVASIQLRPTVTAGATAGTVWFGKLSVKQTATTLLGGLVPLLDASKIGSGVFNQSMVSGLPTMFSGLSPTASIPSQLNMGNITDIQTLNDNIFNYVFGGTATGTTLPQARTALNTHWSTTQSNAIALQAVQASLAPGVNVSYPFTNVANATQLPSPDWVPTYSGAGTSTLGVKSGATGWFLNSDGSRVCTTHHQTVTTTDTQTISTTVTSGGAANTYAALIGRCNAANTDYIICKIVPTSVVAFTAELGFVVAGVYTRWSGPTSIPLNATAQLLCGTAAGGLREYQFLVGSTKVIDYTEVGTLSALDSSHRFCGIQGSTNGTAAPATATNISFSG